MRWFAAVLVLAMSTSNVTASTASRRLQPPHEKPPTVEVATCERVAATLVGMMAQDDPVQTPARITPLLVRHCVADRWSYAARACIVAAKSDADTDRCEPLLTATQIARARTEVESLR